MRRAHAVIIIGCAVALATAGCGQQSVVLGARGTAGTVGAITSVHIVRGNDVPMNHIPPFEATNHDASAAQALAQTVETLPSFPVGPTSCPADVGVTYALTFLSGSATVLTATFDASGCQALTIAGDSQARWTATGPFWPRLAQTFHVSQSFLWAAPQPSGS